MPQIIDDLTKKIAAKSDLVNDWFLQKFKENPASFYNSVDLRHSNFKIAPVDTNAFPAGFNNLGEVSKTKAKKIAADFIAKNFKAAKNILILPENHTRNLRYLENLANLQEILQNDQNQVFIGSMIDEIEKELTLDLENGKRITLNRIKKVGDKIHTVQGFVPDLIILNNDLTSGIPEILQNISTPITPSPQLGWYQRTKSNHFSIYNNLAEEFAALLEIDPWLISSLHRACHDVDFKEHLGVECLAKHVDWMLVNLKEKYNQHGLKEKPYCYIKADNGTYGMAVMPIFETQEILELNKKERNKMNSLKESVHNTMVMVQEGIMTADKINDQIAEPMIYMIGGHVVGNLFRVNDQRNELNSLNSAGMVFHDLENLNENQIAIGGNKDKIQTVYSAIAKLAALACAKEIS